MDAIIIIIIKIPTINFIFVILIFLYKYNAKHYPIINDRNNENTSNRKYEIPKAPVYV